MTYGDVIIAIQGYNERQNEEWRRTRLVSHTVYCSIPEGKGKKKRAIEKWLPLPGDEGYREGESKLSYEDRLERLKAFRDK